MIVKGLALPSHAKAGGKLHLNTGDIVRNKLIIFFAIFILEIILYSKAIHFNFINFDDYSLLLGRPHLYNETSLIFSLKEIIFESIPREGPMLLRDISWAIDSYIFGFKNPLGYHLGNVFLNSINVSLLFYLCLLMGWTWTYALGITLVYGSLPVHVEPVAWVMGRKDLLVAFFMIVGLIVHTYYIESKNLQKKRFFWLAGILVNLLALLAKPNAVTFFLVLISYHLFFPYLKNQVSAEAPLNLNSFLILLPKYIPHAALTVFVYWWYMGAQLDVNNNDGQMAYTLIEHMRNLIIFIPLVLGIYFKLVYIPADFSIYYTWPTIHQSVNTFQIILSFFLTVSWIYFLFVTFKKHKDIFFYAIAFLWIALPYLNILYFGIWIANRYIYFASFFILCTGACILRKSVRNAPKISRQFIAPCLFIFVFLNCIQTWRYQDVWRDDYSLWSYEVEADSPSLVSFAMLSSNLLEKAQSEANLMERLKSIKRAEELVENGFQHYKRSGLRNTTPHLYKLYLLKGEIAEEVGQPYDNQLKYYQKAYKLKPRQEDTLRKMAEVYYRMAEKSRSPEKQVLWASKSLDFFEEYHQVTGNSRKLVQFKRRVLTSFKEYFPFLKLRIVKLLNEINAL